MSYEAERTRSYFDARAAREWDRLETTLQGRVKYAIHRRLLERYVRKGMRVLDVGSGPGRFAIDVARRGARGLQSRGIAHDRHGDDAGGHLIGVATPVRAVS